MLGYNEDMEVSNLSLVYLLTHLGRRVLDFFRHWYLDGFLWATNQTLNVLERLDHFFALRITIKNWLQPLYQDYTIIGYVWGFIFRTLRISVGAVIYAVAMALAIAVFLFWAIIPLLIIYEIALNI